MNPILTKLLLSISILCSFAAADWNHFRGNDNQSTSDCKNLPLLFDMKTGENIAWTADLPGRGPSCPIVVGDQVFVTSSSGIRQDRLHVLAFDTASGKCNWHRQLWATGHTHVHPFGAVAQCTPAGNGDSIFAFYSSNDLACFDLRGNLKWFRGLAHDYPTARNDVGMSSSPLVVGPTVIVQVQNQGESFVAGIDTETGKTRWRTSRHHSAVWSSPTVWRGKSASPEDDLVLLQDRERLTAHDPQTGKMVWQYEAQCHTVASVTTGFADMPEEPLVYLPANGLHALRRDPAGRDVEFLWHEQRLRSGNTSPVVHNGRVYTIKSSGVLVCGDASTGRVLWQLRLKGPFWATPLVAGDQLFAVNHDGAVHIVALGEKGKLLRTCRFDTKILASPIAVDGALYLRSDQHLTKIASPPAGR